MGSRLVAVSTPTESPPKSTESPPKSTQSTESPPKSTQSTESIESPPKCADPYCSDESGRLITFKCGHSLCPETIRFLIENQTSLGCTGITCYGVIGGDKDNKCKQMLDWYQISSFLKLRKDTVFSPNPKTERFRDKTWETVRQDVCRRTLENVNHVKKCPGCKSYTQASVKSIEKGEYNVICPCGYVFCFSCLRKWNNPNGYDKCGNPQCSTKADVFNAWLNTTQEWKYSGKVAKHPGRICPRPECYTKHGCINIAWRNGCKHMTCKLCKQEFCLLCLSIKKEKEPHWKCVGGNSNYDQICIIAPKQELEKLLCVCTGILLKDCKTHKGILF